MDGKTIDCQQNVEWAQIPVRKRRNPVRKRRFPSQVVRDADLGNKKRQINMRSGKETETHTPTDGGEYLIVKGPEEGVEINKVKKNSDILKGKNPVETAHHMVRRKQTEKKKTEKLISPYVCREVAVTDGWTDAEKKIGFWVMNNADADMMEILFYTRQYQLSREQMISLLPSVYVEASVIDIWSMILNHKEMSRSKGSPCRFFASTYLTAYTAVNPVKEWSMNRRGEKFFERLDEEIVDTKWMKLGSIDIFVFPIIHASHFYTMVYDLKNMSIDLIDNSSTMDTGSLKTKYGDVPGSLSQLFNLFLESKGKIKESMELQNVNIRRLSMPWRDDKNKEDCGVFLMRHMETYHGGGEKNWNSGLKKNNKRQLNVLRIKYCAAILKSDVNTLKDQVDAALNLHYQQQCVDGPIDLGPILLNYKPPTNLTKD